MVGVAGKYKGCETCRRRRVKCDNTRPLCRKCLDNGRDCEGYQREMVFITAGLEDGGRCSSHPPRQATTTARKKSKSRATLAQEKKEVAVTVFGGDDPQFTQQQQQQPQFVLEQLPIGRQPSAWDDILALSRLGEEDNAQQYLLQVVAVHVDLQNMAREDAGDGRLTLEEATYAMPEFYLGAPFAEGRDPGDAGRCLVNIPTCGNDRGANGNLCIFVYEHGAPCLPPGEDVSPWGSEPEPIDGIRSSGPRAFQTFPAHHFFARVYRPHAIGLALLHRRETFLASSEWMTAPWETHHKTLLDTLFDTLTILPSVLARADRLLASPPTPSRQHGLQEVLSSSLDVERRLDAWHAAMMVNGGGPGCWLDDQDPGLQIPFGGSLAFRDGASALMCVYHWMALLLLHGCVLDLHHAAAAAATAVFFPAGSYYAGDSEVPTHLVLDEAAYQKGRRQLAAKICQSLGFALAAVPQPDLLAAPLAAAEGFYRGIRDASGQGTLELFWCETFRTETLRQSGEYLAGLLRGGRKWTEIGRF